ncbi:MAG: hypothetical protein AAF984_00170 [Verrucomicrobiota bacterium]
MRLQIICHCLLVVLFSSCSKKSSQPDKLLSLAAIHRVPVLVPEGLEDYAMRDIHDLTGSVRKLVYYETDFSDDSTRRQRKIIALNKHGKIKERTLYDLAGYKTKQIFHYDEQHQLHEIITQTQDDKLIKIEKSFYDASGHCIREEFTGPDSKLNMQVNVVINPETGLLNERINYDASGNEGFCYQYYYDTDLKLTLVNGFENNNLHERTEFYYDEDGFIEQTLKTTRGSLVYDYFQYDGKGRMIEWKTDGIGNEVFSGVRYTYRDDQKGNWVKKEISKFSQVNQDGGDGEIFREEARRTRLIERAITYF